MKIRRITSKADLLDVYRELGVRPDWHEPDEQGVTATTHGVSFDNAGFWGKEYRSPFDGREFTEQYVILHKDDAPVACVNLATLFAWATGLER